MLWNEVFVASVPLSSAANKWVSGWVSKARHLAVLQGKSEDDR